MLHLFRDFQAILIWSHCWWFCILVALLFGLHFRFLYIYSYGKSVKHFIYIKIFNRNRIDMNACDIVGELNYFQFFCFFIRFENCKTLVGCYSCAHFNSNVRILNESIRNMTDKRCYYFGKSIKSNEIFFCILFISNAIDSIRFDFFPQRNWRCLYVCFRWLLPILLFSF